jgi:hypothetical protein
MNPLKTLRKNRKGIMNLILGSIILVVVASILVMISAEVIASTASAMPAVTGAANTTITNITSGAYNGLNLMTVLPVVLAAGAIIAAIVGTLLLVMSRKQQ